MTLAAATSVFAACDDGLGSDGNGSSSAKYHYPKDCQGGKAVWWMEKEACIDQEPVEKHSEASSSTEKKDMYRYTCHLNLGKKGFSGISSFFSLISRNDYTLDISNSNAEPDQWEEDIDSFPIYTHFTIMDDPHDTGYGIQYDTLFAITVTGDKEGDNYVLTIEYLYTHFTRF